MPIELIPTPVPVSEAHISHGHRFRCFSCPLALAINKLLIDGYIAHVSSEDLTIYGPNLKTRVKLSNILIQLPPDAVRFAEDFDEGRAVPPTTFTIPLPRHLLRNPASPNEEPS